MEAFEEALSKIKEGDWIKWLDGETGKTGKVVAVTSIGALVNTFPYKKGYVVRSDAIVAIKPMNPTIGEARDLALAIKLQETINETERKMKHESIRS